MSVDLQLSQEREIDRQNLVLSRFMNEANRRLY